ncbi:MAG: hypothetical protein WC444_04935 [Candidatus Paceibacterota bacterium]
MKTTCTIMVLDRDGKVNEVVVLTAPTEEVFLKFLRKLVNGAYEQDTVRVSWSNLADYW